MVWSLQGKRPKIVEYIYHRMVITRNASENCGIYIPSYGHHKESVLMLQNIYIPSYGHYQENVLKLGNIYVIVSSLQEKSSEVAEYIYHRMVIKRKAS